MTDDMMLTRIASSPLPRRTFLERLTSAVLPLAAVAVGGVPRRAHGASAAHHTEASVDERRIAPPDENWLNKLTGKHRTVFDVETHRNGHVLGQARGFLDVYEQTYGVPAREVNLVLGVRGSGLPLVLADATWAKYGIGEQYAITDPSRGAASARNVFTAANVQLGGPVTAEQSVEALQRRGVLFLVCNNTVNGAAKKFAAAGLGAVDAVRTDILAGLLPGVVLVPAMVIAFSRMQERGIAYVYAG